MNPNLSNDQFGSKDNEQETSQPDAGYGSQDTMKAQQSFGNPVSSSNQNLSTQFSPERISSLPVPAPKGRPARGTGSWVGANEGDDNGTAVPAE